MSRRRMISASRCRGFRRPLALALAWSCAVPALGQHPTEKLAEPDPQRQIEAETLISDLYESDLAKEDPAEMADLAARLLQLGVDTQDDPAARFVLFRIARDLAAKAGEAAIALHAVDEMANWYAIDALGMKLAALETAARSAGSPPAHQALAQGALASVDQAMAANNYDAAERLLSLAGSAAAEANNARLAREVETRRADLASVRSEYERVRTAAAILIEHPDDPEPNLVAGKFLCFVKGNWSKGLPRLVKGSNPTLRALAEKDLAEPSGPGLQVELGDGWWKLGTHHNGMARRHLLARAEHWYERALPKLSGLTRVRVERRMRKKAWLAFDGDNPPTAEWINQHFSFWANYGRQGPAHWANYTTTGETALLAANRGGYVGTRHEYPRQTIARYQIDTLIASDLLPGTALEFGGERMHFSRDGIHLANGWRPEAPHSLEANKPHHYLLDIAPDRITFQVDGEFVGSYKTETLARGPIILRGWEGHLQCYRLVVWAVPEQ